jgi:drug/metabolite transporter (DMT)-like permease
VTMIAEGDVLLYVLLKYAEGQQDTALWNTYPVFLVVLNGFCKESLQ